MKRARDGFTLSEVLMTIVILAVLAAIAYPNFTKTIELGRRREAEDLLMATYAGERVYFFANSKYLDVPPGAWKDISMEDPNPPDGSIQFAVNCTAGCAKFTAKATRQGGQCNNSWLKVTDGNRTPSGTWTSCP